MEEKKETFSELLKRVKDDPDAAWTYVRAYNERLSVLSILRSSVSEFRDMKENIDALIEYLPDSTKLMVTGAVTGNLDNQIHSIGDKIKRLKDQLEKLL